LSACHEHLGFAGLSLGRAPGEIAAEIAHFLEPGAISRFLPASST